MTLSSLDRKLFRDLSAIKGQVLSVGLVMACGLAMMILSRSLIFSLITCRDQYYQTNRMAHVFADLRRAPKSTIDRIRSLAGVTEVETRVKGAVLLDLPGVVEPSDGLILSLPDHRQPRLLQPYLRVGRFPVTRSSAWPRCGIFHAVTTASYGPGRYASATRRRERSPVCPRRYRRAVWQVRRQQIGQRN